MCIFGVLAVLTSSLPPCPYHLFVNLTYVPERDYFESLAVSFLLHVMFVICARRWERCNNCVTSELQTEAVYSHLYTSEIMTPHPRAQTCLLSDKSNIPASSAIVSTPVFKTKRICCCFLYLMELILLVDYVLVWF